MEIKVFELRDRSTCIPILAVIMRSSVPREKALLRKAEYGMGQPLVLLTSMKGGMSTYDPYNWPDRTFQTAHWHIINHWDELQSGDLIDVRYILHETEKPCESDL